MAMVVPLPRDIAAGASFRGPKSDRYYMSFTMSSRIPSELDKCASDQASLSASLLPRSLSLSSLESSADCSLFPI